jgi:hypothetical protein
VVALMTAGRAASWTDLIQIGKPVGRTVLMTAGPDKGLSCLDNSWAGEQVFLHCFHDLREKSAQDGLI